MKDRPILGNGEVCPCGAAMFNRVARCDGLNLHYDICPACGFETYAHNKMRVKRERYIEWKNKDLCDSCTRQQQGCTISAGRTASCSKFQEKKIIPSAVFKSELALITNAVVHQFVATAFRHGPNYFWYIPASQRGHHPPVCRLRGGLVHHVKLAVTFADTFLDMLDIDDTDPRYSQIIAATLLHDLWKRGGNEDELKTFPNHSVANRNHGRWCAQHLSTTMHITPEIEPIIEAIKLHMGRWTQDVTDAELAVLQHNEVVRTTHLADYAASRALHHYLAERRTDTTMEYLKCGRK